MGVYEADAIGIDDIAGGSAVHTTWFIFKLSLFRRAYARDDVAEVGAEAFREERCRPCDTSNIPTMQVV